MHADNGGGVDDSGGPWLRDDHSIILYTLVSLALVVGGHRTWREYHKYRENAARRARIVRLVETSRKEKERERKMVESDASHIASPPALVAVPSGEPESAGEVPHASSSKALTSSTSVQDLKTRAENATAGKRPKERRKRGRDVYKEVLKQERKKSVSAAHTQANSQTNSNLLQVQTTSGSDADASRSRSSSRAHSRSRSRRRSRSKYNDGGSAEDTPRPIVQSPSIQPDSNWVSLSSPVGNTSATLNVLDENGQNVSSIPVSASDSLGILPSQISTSIITIIDTDANATPKSEYEETITTITTENLQCDTPTSPLTHSGPSSISSTSSATSESMSSASSHTSTCASVGAGSPSLHALDLDLGSASTVQNNAVESELEMGPVTISQPVPSAPLGKTQPSWLGSSEAASASESPGNSRRGAIDINREEDAMTHSKIPSSSSVASFTVSEVSANASTSGSGSSRLDSDVRHATMGTAGYYDFGQGRRRASKSPPIPMPLPIPTPPRFRSLSRTSARGSPFPSNSLLLPPSLSFSGNANGSGMSLVDSARRREEAQRREVERCKAEVEAMKVKWSEDVERGRRREAELQAQLQLVTSQMHALSMTVSAMQMHNPHAYIPHTHHTHAHGNQIHPGGFPMPPLSSVPPLPSPGPVPGSVPTGGTGAGYYGFSPPYATPGMYTYPLIATLPHMAPRSASASASASGSRNGSASGSSGSPALGAFDGEDMEMGGIGGGEEDVREELVEAILKRPESIGVRSPSAPARSPPVRSWSNGSGSGSGGGRSASVAGRARASADGFTFASLSELGNPRDFRARARERGREEWMLFDDVRGQGGGGGEGEEGEEDGGLRVASPEHEDGLEGDVLLTQDELDEAAVCAPSGSIFDSHGGNFEDEPVNKDKEEGEYHTEPLSGEDEHEHEGGREHERLSYCNA